MHNFSRPAHTYNRVREMNKCIFRAVAGLLAAAFLMAQPVSAVSAEKALVLDGATGVPTEYEPEVGDVINYTVEMKSQQAFTIKFSQTFCDSLNTNDRLIVTYSAMLNKNAVVGNAEPANVNTAYLSYGEGHKTNTDTIPVTN